MPLFLNNVFEETVDSHAYVLRAGWGRGRIGVQVVAQAVAEVGAAWGGDGAVAQRKAGEQRAGFRAREDGQGVVS